MKNPNSKFFVELDLLVSEAGSQDGILVPAFLRMEIHNEAGFLVFRKFLVFGLLYFTVGVFYQIRASRS